MARNFPTNGDRIRASAGNAAGLNGAVTLAVIAKPDAARDGAWRNLLSMLNSSGGWTKGYAFELGSGGNAVFSPDNAATSSFSTTLTSSSDGWVLLAATKPAGSGQTVRFHRYKYSTGVWVHENMSQAQANAVGDSSGLVEIGGDLGGSTDYFRGDIAIAGAFNVALADQDLEALAYSLQPWFDNSAGLWLLDQSATTQKVVDLSGGGANEASLTGTAVSTASVPVFNYGQGIWTPTIIAPAGGGGGTITLGTISSAAVARGINLSAGPATLPLGSITSGAVARGINLAAGPASLAIGTIAGTATVHGINLSPGAATLALGTVASSAVTLGINLSAGPATLPLGTIAGASVVHGINVLSGTSTIALGTVTGSSTVHGLNLSAGAATLALGTVAASAVTFGINLSAGPATLALGTVGSAATAHGINLLSGSSGTSTQGKRVLHIRFSVYH